MWITLVGLLGKYWKYIAVLVAVLAAIGYVAYLHHEVKAEAATINVQKADIKTLTDANVQLSDAITKQNAAIQSASNELVADKASMAQLQTQLNQQNNKVQTQIKYIKSKPVPQTCPDAIKFLIENRPK